MKNSMNFVVPFWPLHTSFNGEALMAGMSSAEGQKLGAALLEDEGNFIDHSKTSAFIVQEHEF